MTRANVVGVVFFAAAGLGLLAAPITPEMLKQSRENLKDLALAIHTYHDLYGHFPSNVLDKGGNALLSWRVHLLPFMEETPLFNQFKMNEPWDSANNKPLLEKMPKVFAPVRVKPAAGETYYLGFSGKATCFEPRNPVGLSKLVDGTSLTALLVEAGSGVPWTKPEDVPFDAAKDLPKLGGLFDGDFHMALADGSVVKVKKSFDPDIMKRIVTINDGQMINMEAFLK
jgi:hypothetical protein